MKFNQNPLSIFQSFFSICAKMDGKTTQTFWRLVPIIFIMIFGSEIAQDGLWWENRLLPKKLWYMGLSSSKKFQKKLNKFTGSCFIKTLCKHYSYFTCFMSLRFLAESGIDCTWAYSLASSTSVSCETVASEYAVRLLVNVTTVSNGSVSSSLDLLNCNECKMSWRTKNANSTKHKTYICVIALLAPWRLFLWLDMTIRIT